MKNIKHYFREWLRRKAIAYIYQTGGSLGPFSHGYREAAHAMLCSNTWVIPEDESERAGGREALRAIVRLTKGMPQSWHEFANAKLKELGAP